MVINAFHTAETDGSSRCMLYIKIRFTTYRE